MLEGGTGRQLHVVEAAAATVRNVAVVMLLVLEMFVASA